MRSVRSSLPIVTSLCALCVALPVAQDAHAQAPFPSKNLQMIVPYTAGGSIDLFARAIAQRLGTGMGPERSSWTTAPARAA